MYTPIVARPSWRTHRACAGARACLSWQVVGKLPLADLSPKAVELIRERDFPVEIDEAAPSLYAKYEEDRREGGALALTTQGAGSPALSVISNASPALPRNQPPPGSIIKLGSLGSATSGVTKLGPKAGAAPAVKENEQPQTGATPIQPPGKKKRHVVAEAAVDAETQQKKKRTSAAAAAAAAEKEAAAAPAEEEAAAAPAEEEAAEDDAPPPFSKPGFDFLAYDAAKLVKKAPIAHWLPDREEWQVGRVSALLKKKWAEYPNLPKVKGKFPEYSHAFNEADYNKLWLFVKEREFTAQEADIFMA